MRTDERLGTFAVLIEGHTPEVREIARTVRELIVARDPETVEVPRPGEGAAAYGTGPKKMSEAYAYVAPQRTWVNLGFYHAVVLPDPASLLEGTGARIRHVKLRSLGDVERPEIVALLDAAIDERRGAAGPTE